jgi:activator of 2-hydroxyglutaryl-CoA dehydratase
VDERGRVTAFLLSEKCTAGSGRFLQVIAKVLQIDLEDKGELSLKSQKGLTSILDALCLLNQSRHPELLRVL